MLIKKLICFLIVYFLTSEIIYAEQTEHHNSVNQASAATLKNISLMKDAVDAFRDIVHKRETNMNNSKDNINTIKIISLSPIVTENLFNLGLQNNIVGVDNLSDYFKPASGITKVATIDSVNYEEIIKLKPDLIVAWNKFYPDLESNIEKLDIPAKVFRFNTERLTDFNSAILELGRKTHSESKSVELKEQFTSKLNKLRNQYHNYPSHSVIYVLWDDPIYSVSENTWINDMIEICNGVNPLKKIDVAYPVIEQEYLLSIKPDIIINATVQKKKLAIPKLLQDKVRTLKLVEGTHRISLNTLDSLEELCEIIHKDDKLYEQPMANEDSTIAN